MTDSNGFHIALGSHRCQTRPNGAPKHKLSSIVANFAGWIGIDLVLNFLHECFFFEILSFQDMVDFVFFCVWDFAEIWRFFFGRGVDPTCFRIDTPIGLPSGWHPPTGLRCFPVKRLSSRSLLSNVKYTIGNNSKNKNCTKKTSRI